MSRTPDVVDNTVITSAWGNEIRDRTIQVFDSTAERDLWTPADGAYAYVTANDVTYQRTGGAWKRQGNFDYGLGTFLTDAAGWATIPHTLGVSPSACQVTPSGSPGSFASTQMGIRSASSITVMCRNASGAALIGVSCGIHWLVFR